MNKVTIIPKYNNVVKVIEYLKRFGCDVDSVEEPKHVFAVDTVIKDISKLAELKNCVDLIIVYGLTESVLDNQYKSLSSDNFDIEEKFVFYSPNAHHHKGKMSNPSRSGAKYEWIIYREDEPVKGDNSAALLLQHIPPNKKTSCHYHKNTFEFFLPLAGKAIIKIGDEEKDLKNSCFTMVEKEILHQLRTSDNTALNCLCMKPYDPDMKDHFYD
ncbi:cupin domain-containing protein [Candidatus Woesearchaeota archaeon]|nr:cupin domain-containing protein [Candidatus Woesearchaeota archaeon]